MVTFDPVAQLFRHGGHELLHGALVQVRDAAAAPADEPIPVVRPVPAVRRGDDVALTAVFHVQAREDAQLVQELQRPEDGGPPDALIPQVFVQGLAAERAAAQGRYGFGQLHPRPRQAMAGPLHHLEDVLHHAPAVGGVMAGWSCAILFHTTLMIARRPSNRNRTGATRRDGYAIFMLLKKL